MELSTSAGNLIVEHNWNSNFRKLNMMKQGKQFVLSYFNKKKWESKNCFLEEWKGMLKRIDNIF